MVCSTYLLCDCGSMPVGMLCCYEHVLESVCSNAHCHRMKRKLNSIISIKTLQYTIRQINISLPPRPPSAGDGDEGAGGTRSACGAVGGNEDNGVDGVSKMR